MTNAYIITANPGHPRPSRTDPGVRLALAAEAERCRRILTLCAAHGNPTIAEQGRERPLAAIAVEAGWDVDHTRREMTRHRLSTT